MIPILEDTMRAGHYENRRESVDIMIRGSRSVINHLMELGVHFATIRTAHSSTPKRARTPGPASVFTRM